MRLDERLRPLYEEIRECWGQDTAYRGEWSPENPALNQCLPTALLVQDFWGGDILHCRVRDGDRLLDSGDVGERYHRLKERFLHNRFGAKGYREFAHPEGGGR